jgi:hypothetical protein
MACIVPIGSFPYEIAAFQMDKVLSEKSRINIWHRVTD